MLLSIHTILDLIQNTLKNCFLVEWAKITYVSQVTKETNRFTIHLQDDEEKNRKYEIRIYLEQDNDMKKIAHSHVSLLEKCESDFPRITTTFTAVAMYELEKTLNRVLNNVKFFESDLEELN